MTDENYSGLTQLGHHVEQPASPDTAMLERVPNPSHGRHYVVRFTCPEFTSLCPITGQPDFAHIVIDYIPRDWIVESKSLKLYLTSFRNHGAFHEACTMAIAEKLTALLDPVWLRIGGYWYPRGGIPIDVFWQTGAPPDGGMDPAAGRGAVSWPRVIRGLPTYRMCYRHRQGSACVSFWRDRLPYELGADFSQDYLDAAQRISDRDAALVVVLDHYVEFLILFCVIGEYSPPVPQQAGDDQHQERYDPCGTTGEQDRNEVLYLLNLASVSGVLLLFAATHSRSGSANDRSPSEVGFVLRL